MLSPTEQRYAQIEKEALASTWVCERLSDYLVGTCFHLETDHKPLVSIFTTKPLDSLSPRLQRFRLRLLRFDFTVSHVPGKDLITADILSRKPLLEIDPTLEEVCSLHVAEVFFCCTINKLKEIIDAQKADDLLEAVRSYSIHGWPERKNISPLLDPYWNKRHNFSVFDDVLVMDSRIVLPRSLLPETLQRIHTGHLGITKCRDRTKEILWWPGWSDEIKNLIDGCTICAQFRPPRHEPLMQLHFPSRPWQKVGMDIMKVGGSWYLVMIDRYSRFPEVEKLENCRMETIIEKMKAILGRHGIPDEIYTDNGPQINPFFGSRTFDDFKNKFGFRLVTRSPMYPQSNGLAEAAVKIVKNIIEKEKDWQLGLLVYRNSPLENGYSPAQLSMNRKLRDLLPITETQLKAAIPDNSRVTEKEVIRRKRIERNYNTRHGVSPQPALQPGTKVFVKDLKKFGEVLAPSGEPRSYIINTDAGASIRRNRYGLTPLSRSVEPIAHPGPAMSDTSTSARPRRIIVPPQRLNL